MPEQAELGESQRLWWGSWAGTGFGKLKTRPQTMQRTRMRDSFWPGGRAKQGGVYMSYRRGDHAAELQTRCETAPYTH
jgi:hypothetical protein